METDVRDYKGQLVISHDLPAETAMSFEKLLQLYSSIGNNLCLALNIKSDGLQDQLRNLLAKYEVRNYFVFDMSVPDSLIYLKKNLNVFTRQSEYELNPALYDAADGVWLDEFQTHWITKSIIENHLNTNKKICIVSPELHGRTYSDEWKLYKQINSKQKKSGMMLCTDYPEQANKYFNE